jgi:DNA adenine methylase
MESSNYRPVRPVVPPAPYLGGKKRLAERLAAWIGEIDHATYAEPFMGMGGVFFRRRARPKSEVVNDISRDVITLFRILQRHFPQFQDMLKYQITSRAEFERLVAVNADTLTDLERAARFIYLQRTAYGGKIMGRNFGVSFGAPVHFDVTRLAPILQAVHERLAGVLLECRPWSEFIALYDRADTLFYIDPPYWDCETDYGPGVFAKADFTRLADQLAAIQGRFILSLNDVPQIHAIFAAFHIEVVPTTYTIGQAATGSGQRVGEVLISNIDPATRRQAALL